LSGVPGAAAVRGVGLLFLMWNVPYIAAVINPRRNRLVLVCALIMQALGFMGESFIWLTLPVENAILRMSIVRFMGFDGIGLIFLWLAFWMTTRQEAV
jgi:hypothetical protein